MTSPRALAHLFDTLLLDLDGVVYVGDEPVPNAVTSLNTLAADGLRLRYVTNNASRTPESVTENLNRFGLSVRVADVVTSAQAGAALIAEQVPAGSTIMAVGGPGVAAALRAKGFEVVDAVADARPDHGDQVDGVLQGFGTGVGWTSLARAALAVAAGVPWVATNTDLTIPIPGGIGPGNGTLVAAVATATGRTPEVAGKPFPPLLTTAAEDGGGLRPVVIGDRLDTDMEGATNAKMLSVLVLTGVTHVLDLWRAAPDQRPTYLAGDLRGLLAPPLLVAEGEAGAVTCGAARARLVDTRLDLAGGDPVARIWAAAHLWWGTEVEPDNGPDLALDLDVELAEWLASGADEGQAGR